MAATGTAYVTVDGHGTLENFARTIQARQKYLNETASAAVTAMAMDTLRSLRAVTKVAKPASVKPTVTKRGDLKFSFTSTGRGKSCARKMCIRTRAGQRVDAARVRYAAGCRGAKPSTISIFEFADTYSKGNGDSASALYLIAAPTAKAAKDVAKKVVASRLVRHAGLARRAMSVLMVKTNTKAPAENVSQIVDKIAKANTRVVRRDSSVMGNRGDYSLTLHDDLLYAKNALKGGDAAIRTALMKAANKSAGLISHKAKDLLKNGRLDTPFPEVVSRKAS